MLDFLKMEYNGICIYIITINTLSNSKNNIYIILYIINNNKYKYKIEYSVYFIFYIYNQERSAETLATPFSSLFASAPRRVAGFTPGVELAVACAKQRNYYALDAPKTDPTIGIEKERIAVGELLRANCTTGNSRPASAITWKLNKDLVSISSEFSHALFQAAIYVCPRAVATWPYWMIKVPQGTPSLRLPSRQPLTPRSVTFHLPFHPVRRSGELVDTRCFSL